MRFLFLSLLLAACASSGPRYTTSHEWVGTGGGFMFFEKREGINYYYRFEEDSAGLKLHLMLVNTTAKPYKLKAQDFHWQDPRGTQHYPEKKTAWIKAQLMRAETLKGVEQKQLVHDVSLMERFMLDEESHLVPDSPTKTYVLLPMPAPALKNFTLYLGPRSGGVKVKRE